MTKRQEHPKAQDLVGLIARVVLECRHCGQRFAITHISEEVSCEACHKTIELPKERWRDWFGSSAVIDALQQGEDKLGGQIIFGQFHVSTDIGRKWPKCRNCEARVDPGVLKKAAQAEGMVCDCGAFIHVRKATSLVRSAFPWTTYVVHERPPEGKDVPCAGEPIILRCAACAGSLSVDGRSRSVTCSFCNNANYLPDSVWRRLHPPRPDGFFFLILQPEGKAIHALNFVHDPDTAGDPKTPLEELKRLSCSTDAETRAAVAGNPGASPELLQTLARDKNDDVLVALAQNAACPETILATLVDGPSRVQIALANNPNTSRDTLMELALDSDASVREGVATNPATPGFILSKAFLNEKSGRVLKALASRQDLPVALRRSWTQSEVEEARSVAAGSPDIPLAEVAHLAADKNFEVAAALVTRPDLDIPTLRKLADYNDDRVCQKAKKHPGYQAVLNRDLLVGLLKFLLGIIAFAAYIAWFVM